MNIETTNHALSIQNLNKKYDRFQLKDLSFKVPTGSIMGFIGENGAGKTTTMKLILNQIRKDSGTISVLGMDNIKDEKKVKTEIGVVFDESYFHDTLAPNQISKIMNKVFSNWDDALYHSYLNQFSLPVQSPVKEFSRGMKMKLSLAAALAHHPKLLLLDEPTSGLDPMVRNEILDLFLDFIQKEDHTILFSSHITSDLEKVADYITLLHEGRLLLSESKDDLIDRHGILRCGQQEFQRVDKNDIISFQQSRFGCEALVYDRTAAAKKYPNSIIDAANIEEIMLYYINREKGVN